MRRIASAGVGVERTFPFNGARVEKVDVIRRGRVRRARLYYLRGRTGRAWQAIRARETVAEALGINIAGYKLLAFVISSAITAFAGALFAYYRGFVSVEAF